MTATRDLPGLRALGEQVSVVLPDAAGWDRARSAWNLAVDQRPAAVVYPETPADVAAIVRCARDAGVRIAFNGGGHNAGPIGWGDPALLVKTERLGDVRIDAARRRATVAAGTLSDELAVAAGEHGLAFLAGTSPDVGVVGYALGGGLSWLVRKHGLAANSVTAVELVTADGQPRRVTAENEPDLFWALRGGGGNFGAVTALELELFPVAKVYGGCLFWPIERAVEILTAWRSWIETVPEDCTSLARLLALPDLPSMPERLRGRSFAIVELVFLGDELAGAELLRPLRELAPELDTLATIPASRLSSVNMDPTEPVPYCGEGIQLHSFDGACVERTVDLFVGSPLLHFEVRHLGGAVARSAPGHGALDRVDAPFATLSFGLAPDADAYAAVADRLTRLHEALAPWDSGTRLLNFAESPMDVEMIYPRSSWERLRVLKQRYDPDHIFLANHPIRAAAPGQTYASDAPSDE